MRNMKQSIFNLSYTMDGYYIILNTKTQNLIRFPREQKSLIDEILQQNIKSVNPEILKILMEKGYIIDDDVDELKEIYKQCYELVNSNILYLTIMPTYTCNLACVYCFQHHIPGAIIDDIMVHKIINAVEKNIQKYSALYLEWFGGELLMLP